MASKRRIPKGKPAKPGKPRKRPTTGGLRHRRQTPPRPCPRHGAASGQLPAEPMRSARGATPAAPVIVNSQGALLRFLDAAPAELNTNYSDADLLVEARDWNYRLRDRRRWSTRTDSVNMLRSQAKDFVRKLGVNEVILEQLVRARVVQIDLPAGQDPKVDCIAPAAMGILAGIGDARVARRDEPVHGRAATARRSRQTGQTGAAALAHGRERARSAARQLRLHIGTQRDRQQRGRLRYELQITSRIRHRKH